MPRGKIELIMGPMFSGKSTELIRRVNRLNIAGRSILYIKHGSDNRYGNMDLYTHDKRSVEAISATELMPIYAQASNYDVIGIDEGQFYPDIIDFSERLAFEGKICIISCLDGNFKREPFEQIQHLISKADKIDKLVAVCKFCGEDAPFSLRTINSEEEVSIGGAESYAPACRECYAQRFYDKKH